MRWATRALGDCATLVNGRAYKQEELLDSGTPVLRIQNLNGGDRWYYSDLQLPRDKYCEKDDLLFAWSASFGPYIWEGPRSIYHYHIWKVIPGEELDKKFFYHLLASLTDRVRRESHGASMLHMTKARMEAMEIPLPPLEEQRRIATILDKTQNLKAKAADRSILISALCSSLFLRRFGLPSENPHNLPMHRLVDICSPKQWPTISSKQLQDHGYPVFGANGLIGYFDRFNHSEPTVLVTCRGATCGTVNISPPNCYVTGNSMAMDDPDPSLLTTDYLAWVLRLRGMYDVISGSAQPQITRQGLEAVTIPVPPIEAQNDFSNELMAVSGMSESSRHSEDSLSYLTNSLAGILLVDGS